MVMSVGFAISGKFCVTPLVSEVTKEISLTCLPHKLMIVMDVAQLTGQSTAFRNFPLFSVFHQKVVFTGNWSGMSLASIHQHLSEQLY
jgi:hypothetical protein